MAHDAIGDDGAGEVDVSTCAALVLNQQKAERFVRSRNPIEAGSVADMPVVTEGTLVVFKSFAGFLLHHVGSATLCRIFTRKLNLAGTAFAFTSD
jgi:hypothetical protein